jgi:hypothetical protein
MRKAYALNFITAVNGLILLVELRRNLVKPPRGLEFRFTFFHYYFVIHSGSERVKSWFCVRTGHCRSYKDSRSRARSACRAPYVIFLIQVVAYYFFHHKALALRYAKATCIGNKGES